MKFISYDVRNALIRDEEKTDVWNNWRHRREAVLDLIRSSDPDVLALQEDTHEQLNYVLDGLQCSHRACFDPAFYDADTANDAILVRSTIEISRSGAFWISGDGKTASKPEGSICMCHATYGRLHLGGDALLTVNMHLDHSGDQAVKRNEMEYSTHLLGGLSGTPPRRTIVMGDFNGLPDAAPCRLLEDFGLRDAAGLQGNGKATYVHWAERPALDRVDFVSLSGDLRDRARRLRRDQRRLQRQDGSTGHASDHSAVFAHFRF
jgi:endonuclease/exonuclease/phosphatase family metal-dependent hydrolase